MKAISTHKVIQVGTSAAVVLVADMLEIMDLSVGDKVIVSSDSDSMKITIEKI